MSKAYFSSGNTVMDIRLAVLRTIAMVWSDDSQTEHIPGKSKGMRYRLEKNSAAQNIELLSSMGYKPPSDAFGIKFLAANARWNFFRDHQWTKHQCETIEITLPILPKLESGSWSKFDKAEKLIEYYSHFPSFFGIANNDTERPEQSSTMPVDAFGNNYSMGVSQDIFFSFSDALIKLIAAAWDNELLISILNYDYRVNDTSNENLVSAEAYFEEISDIFKRYFHYECPWKFNIKFVLPDDNAAFWKKDDDVESDKENFIWNELGGIRNVLSIEIPYSPVGTEDISLALARYNATGPAYPFTCS
jgi:ribosomally synthesized peptide (two-chain TOMM family)